MTSTIDTQEIDKFSKLADEWWNENGKFKALHLINPLRLNYIKGEILKHFTTLSKLMVVDVGCGGGLVSVPFCKMGATVTGIDASQENILIAQDYANRQNLNIEFIHTAIEQVSTKFDVVLALEIIEHVANPAKFIGYLTKVIKPGGLIFVSTINRNLKSLALAKIAAEYFLRWAPIGTHDWDKFITPMELDSFFHTHGFSKKAISGMNFNPLTFSWEMSESTDINYITCYQKA